MPKLASSATLSSQALFRQDARSLLARVETEARDRIRSFDITLPVTLGEKTNRSLLADIEVKAHCDGASLKTTPLKLDGTEVATAYSFERKLLGLATGIHDGVVTLSAHWASHLTPWLWHRLQDLTAFELAIYRVAGSAMPKAAPDRFAIRNRSLTALMKAHTVQEVMPLGHSFEDVMEQLGQSTRRNVKRCLQLAAENNVEFSFSMDTPIPAAAHLRELSSHNMPRSKSFSKISSIVRFNAAQPRPYHASLTNREGRSMSAAGGFIEGDLALMAYQLNHRADRDARPSLMLRALLIQQLIDCGVRYLAFIGGGGGLLLHACERVSAPELLLISNTRSARIKHQACLLLQPNSRIARFSDSLPKAAEP